MNNFSISDEDEREESLYFGGRANVDSYTAQRPFPFLIILVGKCKKVYPSDIGNKVKKKKKKHTKDF